MWYYIGYMKKQTTSDNAVKHVGEYVDERLSGSNKQEAALRAGYSESTARTPSLIERTKAYAVVVTEMLDKNTRLMRAMTDSLEQDIESGFFDLLPPKTKVEIAYKLAQIHDTLTPKITVKETTDAKGNKTRQTWGTTGSPQPATEADEE